MRFGDFMLIIIFQPNYASLTLSVHFGTEANWFALFAEKSF